MGVLLNLETSFSFTPFQVCSLKKTLSWFYNERHNCKGPMDGMGGIIKNVILKKVKYGHNI